MGIKVSIIVPVYGTEHFLRKCLDSLVGQTLKEIEILVINDNSPDNSQDIIAEYEARYSHVHGFKKENGGLSDTRNYGIRHAAGEFVVFVDSDDYVELDMCQVMYEKAMEEDLDIVVADTFMDYENRSYILKADQGLADNAIKNYIFCYPNAPARMIRTNLMKEHLFTKGTWYEDLELMPTMAAYTEKIGFVNRAFYHYIQHEGSIMNQTAFHAKFYDIFTVLENVKKAYVEKNLYEKYYRELEYLYIIHLQRSAVLRFVGMTEAKDCLEKVHCVMKEEFPQWAYNPYLKKSSWKIRLICFLGKRKQYRIISLLKKLM